jgi:uncharacterized protein (DUF1697 family)
VTTFVVLLRGVNVGGNRKLPMAELRQALAGAGFGRVRSYIQSGNLLVDADTGPGEVASRVQQVIEDGWGFAVPVLVRTAAQMAQVAAADPFAGRGLDPAKVAVTFLSGPAPDLVVPEGRPEEAHSIGAEVWVYYPEGMGRSTLDRTGFWKPAAGLDATARNLRTTRKLRDLASAPE